MYCPAARRMGDLRDVYLFGNESHEPTHIEVVNRQALMIYGQSGDRRSNNRIIRYFYKLDAETNGRTGKRGCINRAKGETMRLSIRKETYMGDLSNLSTVQIRYLLMIADAFRILQDIDIVKADIRGLYDEGVDLPKTTMRLTQVAYKGVEVRDWDIRMAYFTSAAQAVGGP